MYRPVLASAALATALLVTGCATNDHPDKIPAAALRVTEGDGKIAYTTASDGTAYVYDRRANRIVWSGPIAAGQMITIDPASDDIKVGDRLAAEDVLQRNTDYEIYFNAWPAAPAPAPAAVIVTPAPNTTVHTHTTPGATITTTTPDATISTPTPAPAGDRVIIERERTIERRY